jgi:hypothetical protein
VLTAVAIIPAAPVLLPELAGASAAAVAELADLRTSVLTAAGALPDRWIAVGVGPSDTVIEPASAGSFAGFGVDVKVALAPGVHPIDHLPLCALIAGWVRGAARPGAHAEVRCYAADHEADAAVDGGRRLRAEIDGAADPVGVLLIADGAHTLTPAAPGGYRPASAAVQDDLDNALACGDAAALAALPKVVVGRVAFAVLAGLAERGVRAARELYRGAPYGVGYFAGVWQV